MLDARWHVRIAVLPPRLPVFVDPGVCTQCLVSDRKLSMSAALAGTLAFSSEPSSCLGRYRPPMITPMVHSADVTRAAASDTRPVPQGYSTLARVWAILAITKQCKQSRRDADEAACWDSSAVDTEMNLVRSVPAISVTVESTVAPGACE